MTTLPTRTRQPGQPLSRPSRAPWRTLGTGAGLADTEGIAAHVHPALGGGLGRRQRGHPGSHRPYRAWLPSCSAARRRSSVSSACCAGPPTGPNPRPRRDRAAAGTRLPPDRVITRFITRSPRCPSLPSAAWQVIRLWVPSWCYGPAVSHRRTQRSPPSCRCSMTSTRAAAPCLRATRSDRPDRSARPARREALTAAPAPAATPVMDRLQAVNVAAGPRRAAGSGSGQAR